ncbi:carbonic anhydrase family protein [Nitrobacteraceae bacterium UC4446_H13]
MLSRRAFCGCASAALWSGFVATRAEAEPAACAVMTKDNQRATSPADALARLKAGNERFVGGHTVNCDLLKQAKETAKGQAPFATVVGCIDSRVPPELVFDQRIGDIFCARVAGNFVNTDIIGSLEFATKITGTRAIVVLGHNECGAVKGAIDNAKLGNLTATLANIRPAVKATKANGDRTSKNAAFVQAVAETNVRMAVAELTAKSPVMKQLVAAGDLKVVGAMHDLATGKVSWLS